MRRPLDLRPPDPAVRFGRYAVSSFQVCAGIGLVTCLLLAGGLTVYQGLSVAVTVVLACAGLLAFLAMTLITKVIVGEEILIYYHDEIAVLVTAAAVLYLTGLPVLPYLDVSVLAVGTLLAFGRLGCFSVGCCHGRPGAWGVRYRREHADAGFPRSLVGVPLFPIPLVEAVWAFSTVAAGALLIVSGAPPGEALAWYTTVYGIGRFLFEFARGDSGRPYVSAFSEAQWTSCILMTINAALELTGVLPLRLWHVAATATLIVAMVIIARADTRDRRLLRARHLREIADLIDATRQHARLSGEIHLGRTSLGIQMSATDLHDGPRHLEVIAFSSCGPTLSTAAAEQLGRAIGRLRGCCEQVQVMTGDRGVYRLVVPSLRRAYAV